MPPLSAGASPAVPSFEMPARPEESERMTSEIPVKTSTEERAERAERMAREGAQAMADHKAAIKAVDDRTVKLRKLRLAREAEDAVAKEAAKPAPKRKRAVKA